MKSKDLSTVVKELMKNRRTLSQLGIGIKEVRAIKENGYNLKVELVDGKAHYWIKDVTDEESQILISPASSKVESLSWAEISDTHAGSVYFDKKGLEWFLKQAWSEGIRHVHHSGDFVDGIRVYSGQQNWLKYWRQEDQVNELCDVLSKFDFDYYGIDGNHDMCVMEDTEILTEDGWVDFKELKKEMKVATIDLKKKTSFFEMPKHIIRQEFDGELFIFENNRTKQVVSPNHFLILDDKRVPAKNVNSFNTNRMVFGQQLASSGAPFSDDEIRLVFWILDDGCIVMRNNRIHHIQFKLSKERKINELTRLLNSMNIPYTLRNATMSGINVLQPKIIRIYGEYARNIFEMLHGNKRIPKEFLHCSQRQVFLILDCMSTTDGHLSDYVCSYSSTDYEKLSLLQAMFTLNGMIAIIEQKNLKGFNVKNIYDLTVMFGGASNNKLVQRKKIPYSGMIYCVDTSTGVMITRLDGRVAITGNSWVKQGAPRIGKLISDRIPKFVYIPGKTENVVRGDMVMAGVMKRLAHPWSASGRSAYALSYPAQTYLRNVFQHTLDFEIRDKKYRLQLLQYGHLHFDIAFTAFDVKVTHPLCFQKGNDFTEGKGFGGRTGGRITRVTVQDGLILDYQSKAYYIPERL